MELRNKRVLITGASRGIGRAIAEEVSRRGATVAAVARSAGPLDELVGRIGGTAHVADLCRAEDRRGLLERVEDEVGQVDVVVNNAGIDAAGPLHAAAADDVEALLVLNLVAPIELTRQALERMRDRPGHVVNISSMAACAGFGGMAPYCASKAGLSHFGRVLDMELGDAGIGLTTVELGLIPTDMKDAVYAEESIRLSFERLFRTRLSVEVPVARVAAAVADAVESNRKWVRLPTRTAAFPLISGVPQRLTRLILTGVPQR